MRLAAAYSAYLCVFVSVCVWGGVGFPAWCAHARDETKDGLIICVPWRARERVPMQEVQVIKSACTARGGWDRGEKFLF